MLSALYRAFLPSRSDTRLTAAGPHWEEIGFQRGDPSTDLNRSMGIFSILQVLCCLEPAPCLPCLRLSHLDRETGITYTYAPTRALIAHALCLGCCC